MSLLNFQRIIDLLKHTVNITPVQRSSSCSCTLSSPLICREASIRHLTQWEEIEKAAVRIQVVIL